jgi:hypothetical protein
MYAVAIEIAASAFISRIEEIIARMALPTVSPSAGLFLGTKGYGSGIICLSSC